VRRTVLDAVREFDRTLGKGATTPIQVDVTGHSMGGALALLCTLDLDALFLDPSRGPSELAIPPKTLSDRVRFRVFTYGEPRVGNLAFSRFAATIPRVQSMTRTTYNYDPVPHLPPRFLDYIHHGTELYLTGWWFDNENQGGLLTNLKQWVRDGLGWEPNARFCGTRVDEDSTCIDKDPFIPINILSHLRAWNVTFGPWC